MWSSGSWCRKCSVHRAAPQSASTLTGADFLLFGLCASLPRLRIHLPALQVEQRGVEVNQRDASRGWTPLMRCARMAHYKHAPFLQVRPLWCMQYVLLWGMQSCCGSSAVRAAGAARPSRSQQPSQRTHRSPRPAQPCAHNLHSPNNLHSSPLVQVFEYLLQKGADAAIQSFPGPGPSPELKAPQQLPQPPLLLSNTDGELGLLDVATHKGFGWEPGAVRAELTRLIEQYKDAPKAPPTVYYGPHLGERGTSVRMVG